MQGASDPLLLAAARHLEPLAIDKRRPSTADGTAGRSAATSPMVMAVMLGAPRSTVSSPTGSNMRTVGTPTRKSSRRIPSMSADHMRRATLTDEGSDEEDDDQDDQDAEQDAQLVQAFDAQFAAKHQSALLGGTVYEEDGQLFQGRIDRRGITPHVVFATHQMPRSLGKHAAIGASNRAQSCGFCNGTNLVWMLRCAFCGCTRMSDAPRLKYLLDMIQSVEPLITAKELAKRVLDYAQFDHVALKVEQRFHQASLVRAKAAITMMGRTMHLLRGQILRMIFSAWRGIHVSARRHEDALLHVIKIKEAQARTKQHQVAFRLWRAYTMRVADDRAQRLTIAIQYNQRTHMRRCWSAWAKYRLIRAKEILRDVKAQHEAEKNEAPNAWQREIASLRENLDESHKLVTIATTTVFDILQQSLRGIDTSVLRMLELAHMHPSTARTFMDQTNGPAILDALQTGQGISTEEWIADEAIADTRRERALAQARATVEGMPPWLHVVQWVNFQRRRAATIKRAPSTTPDCAAVAAAAASAGASATATGSTLSTTTATTPSSRRPTTVAAKPSKEKKREWHDVHGLQELRSVLASPSGMLKLLLHLSMDARREYDRIRPSGGGRKASMIALSSIAPSTDNGSTTASTALSSAEQAQLKLYFKLLPTSLHVPTDIATKDAFVLNDFDALYAHAVYLYVFHTNVIAPEMPMTSAPTPPLSWASCQTQWRQVQMQLRETQYEPFAQQQYLIFLAKLKRMHKLLLRLEDVSRGVEQIAQWHREQAMQMTFNDLARRVLGRDSGVAIALEKETLAAWVTLTPARVLELCADAEEMQAIENVFKEHVLELVKLFRLYGSGTGAGGKGLLEQEFLKIMTRAGVTDRKTVLRSHLQALYQQARNHSSNGSTSSSNSSTPAASSSGDATPASNPGSMSPPPSSSTTASGSPTNPANDATEEDPTTIEDRGASPNEFFEALVRVAHHLLLRRREAAALTSSAITTTISDSPGSDRASMTSSSTDPNGSPSLPSMPLLPLVRELVVDKVVPLTKKCQEQGLTFKKLLVHPEVQSVCKAQEKKLKRVFFTYSQKNKNPSARGKLMDLSDFELLLKDRKMIDALFPHGRIKQLVAFVQQDGDVASLVSATGNAGNPSSSAANASANVANETETEFVYTEFIEALAAIAVYRNANPYLPLAKKLEAFFTECV